MMDIKEVLLQWFINFFNKKSRGVTTLQNKGEELHKSIIRKFKRRRVYSSFKDNIWVSDLADN